MGEKTAIPWCDHTFNPWFGCHRVSEGCRNCYAATFAKRLGLAWERDYRFFSLKHWGDPLKWDVKAAKLGERKRVFCGSMCDIFEDGGREIVECRERVFRRVEETPHLDWLLLTKRPENMLTMPPGRWREDGWPRNAWAMTTVENQNNVRRLDVLERVPAATRGVSCEPLLSPIELGPHARRVSWVIAGAESGPHRRPMSEDWVRSLRDQCAEVGTAFFYKQAIAADGGKIECPYLDSRQWLQFPEVTR